MLNNKKILLVCKETYSAPLFYVAKKLKEKGNDVAVFFILSEESSLRKSKYNNNTYYFFKKNFPKENFFDVKDISLQFKKNYKNPIIDYAYLEKIEKKYGVRRNINLQLLSSQFTSKYFHYRGYFRITNEKENLYWLELNYKNIEYIMNTFNPDVILDLDNAELQRTILNEICNYREKPYITLEYPRYKNYKIPTLNLGLSQERFLLDEYEKFYSSNEKELINSIKYIENFRNMQKIMSNEYKGDITSKYEQDSILEFIRKQINILKLFINIDIINRNYKYRLNKCPIFTNPIKHYLFNLQVELKKQILYRKNKYFSTPKEGENYIYMPLHLIPESTTFVKSPFYIDEKYIIEQISKSLPIGWKLYVKEHQAMLGERPLSFYKKIAKLPNVKIVQLNYYNDPKPWITNSKGVITITGTTAYEAALLGKKAIVFGNTPFNIIDGINRIDSFEKLPEKIAEFNNEEDNIKSCASYIETIKKIGQDINIKYLINKSLELIDKNIAGDDKFEDEINKLIDLYSKGYEIYYENKEEMKK